MEAVELEELEELEEVSQLVKGLVAEADGGEAALVGRIDALEARLLGGGGGASAAAAAAAARPRVAVFGGTGFIGRHVAGVLEAAGCSVLVARCARAGVGRGACVP